MLYNGKGCIMNMPENIRWDAVWQSVTDTWMPLLIVILAAAGLLLFWSVRKRKSEPFSAFPHRLPPRTTLPK